MRYLFILPLTSLVPAVISAQEAMPPTTTMTKTPCASSFGYDGVDQMKSNLLLQAKRIAVNELFGELITAVTQVQNIAVIWDQIQAFSAAHRTYIEGGCASPALWRNPGRAQTHP